MNTSLSRKHDKSKRKLILRLYSQRLTDLLMVDKMGGMRRVVVITIASLTAVFILSSSALGVKVWYERAQMPQKSKAALTEEREKSDGVMFNDAEPTLKARSTETEQAIGGSASASNPQSGGSLVPQGNSTGQGQTGGSSPKVLTPDQFVAYEQYKKNEAALYQDLRVGEGAEAGMNSKITVNYRGWLTDGRKFDDSYLKGRAFTFVIGGRQVIPGWEQGTFGMKEGGKRRLIVPPAVGYGSEGKDPIPPNSVLVFDIELLKVEQ